MASVYGAHCNAYLNAVNRKKQKKKKQKPIDAIQICFILASMKARHYAKLKTHRGSSMQDLYIEAVHIHAKKGEYHQILSHSDESIGYAVFIDKFGDVDDTFIVDDSGKVTNNRVTDAKLLDKLKNLIEDMI